MMSRIAFAALAISVVALVGCPEQDLCEDVTCPGDEVCNPETGECVECVSNSDCNDGLFCNGVETCTSSNTCAAGMSPCDEDEVCDEETDTCAMVPCEVPADCPDDGLFCTGARTCTAGVCGFSGDPCAGTALPACDEDSNTCVECLMNEDCAEGEVCDTDVNTCGLPECAIDDDCPDDGLFCTGTPTCTDGTCGFSGDPCAGTATPVCDEDTDTCVADGNGGDAAAGQAFYMATCQSCHGAGGTGGFAPDLRNKSAAELQAGVEAAPIHDQYTITAEDYANLEAFLANGG